MDSPIQSLPPNYEIRALFDPANQYLGSDNPLSYVVTVTYHGGMRDEERVASYVLDLEPYKGIMFVKEYDLKDITKAISSLERSQAKTLQSISSRLASIKPISTEGVGDISSEKQSSSE